MKIIIKIKGSPGSSSIQLTHRTKQVSYKSYPSFYKCPRIYPYGLTHTGAHKPESRPRPHRPRKPPIRKPKVNKENDLSIDKEPHYLDITNPGLHPSAKMNSRIELGDSAEVPAAIFSESDVESGELYERNPLTQAQENPTPGTPPAQDQQETPLPDDNVNSFSCGTCGELFPTPDAAQAHMEICQSATDPPIPDTPVPGPICAQEQPVVVMKATVVSTPEDPEAPAHEPGSTGERPAEVTMPPETELVRPPHAPTPEVATSGSAPGGEVGGGPEDTTKAHGQWQKETESAKGWFNPSICQMDSSDEEDENGRISPLYKDVRPDLYPDYVPPPTTQEQEQREVQHGRVEVDVLQETPETPAPGVKCAQEKPQETEQVQPPPAPSSEVAAPGPAPGGVDGVDTPTTNNEPAINEPLSKRKAQEWGRVEDPDLNKEREEARLQANKTTASTTAKTVEKNKDQDQAQTATLGKAPPKPDKPRNQTVKPPTTRSTTAEDKRKAKAKANAKLPKKSKPLPPPVKFPQLDYEEIVVDDEDEIEIISSEVKKQTKPPGTKSAQDTQRNKSSKITKVATPGSTPHPYSRGGKTSSSPKTEGAGIRKPKRPTDPEPEVVTIGSKRITISREKRTAKNSRAWDMTKKNLRSILRLREKQRVYVSKDEKTGKRGGPDQDAINLQERMLQNHEIVILGDGQAALVRDMSVPFKVRHGEEKFSAVQRAKSRRKRKEKEKIGIPAPVPEGQVMQHVRLQKKRFMGKPVRKHTCGFAFELRAARARQKMIKESYPPLKKSVRIKPRDGRTPYIRHDPRVVEAARNLRYEKRAQTPHDKNINKDFNEFVKRGIEEIKLVDLGDTDSEFEFGIEIDNEPSPAKHLRVGLANFLEAPNQMGNQSGEESDYDEYGTNILIKEETQSEDSEAEGGYCHPNDRHRTRSVSTQANVQPLTCSKETQCDTGIGSTESSTEDDDEPPTDETAKAARQLLMFNATQFLSADLETTVAFFQSLAKSKHSFKAADGTKRTCGVDFLNLNITKDAKVKIKNKRKRKGTGKKSSPGNINAQERDPDILEIGVSNEDKQLVKSTDPPAGPKEKAGERGRIREKKNATPQKELGDGGKKRETKRKRESSKKDKWLKFFHDKHTEEDDIARTDWASHQLLVLGLSKTHGKRPPPRGPTRNPTQQPYG